jgi:hypothetical protein
LDRRRFLSQLRGNAERPDAWFETLINLIKLVEADAVCRTGAGQPGDASVDVPAIATERLRNIAALIPRCHQLVHGTGVWRAIPPPAKVHVVEDQSRSVWQQHLMVALGNPLCRDKVRIGAGDAAASLLHFAPCDTATFDSATVHANHNCAGDVVAE